VEYTTSRAWRGLLLGSLVFLLVATGLAFASQRWVLTAIPIGFLFGFFLERADLCGASAISEVILMKDARKLGGLWILIVVSMLAFAAGSGLDWIPLHPKPLLWANYLVGGALFGVGMVLAGGCVSGTLFKVGQGNLNSMAALLGIPIGIGAVEYGPLQGVLASLKSHVVSNAEGGSVTLSSITGLSYWILAVIIAAATLAVILLHRRRRIVPQASEEGSTDSARWRRILTRSWKPWQAGAAIGLLALAAYASSVASGRNYPLGVTHGVLHVELLATDYPVKHVYEKPRPKSAESPPADPGTMAKPAPTKKVVWWLVCLVTFLTVGSHVSARLRGSFRLLPKPPDEIIVAFFGGLLVGAGAALARGCVVGNIMSGIALMSVGNMLFVLVVILANWATTYLYLRGRGGSHSAGA